VSNWRAMSERAAAAAARGEGYRTAALLRTAAHQYRLAADMLDQAVLLRKTEIGGGK
jgi:hypothetical protein